MIELITWNTQYLNGCNVIKQSKIQHRHFFETKDEMEEYRRLKEMKLQWKSDQKKEDVKISVILDYKEIT